ncbi:MAG: ATP-binding cassette domain-containing protein [Bacteroidales bacterium]|jgi:phospholipid/cholesterol/gamma-HCH transport system ATP-binding protein|nr:ATP-binding cassette domain-containing protein [Bacteroidales bacterium]
MIELYGIQKSFDGRMVIKDIDAVFETGRTNLIIGQSGSGKTVLLKCVVGLLEPDAGDILYDGRSLTSMNKRERVQLRTEMGMLFQGSALFDSMTIEENVQFPLSLFSSLSPLEQEKRAHYCLDRVGLSDSHKLFPAEISGGMQKRAAIARAIALNPKYLFCDEPNSGLDPLTSITIDELISDITKEFNMTTVINTHDMNSVLTMGENILFIYQGEKTWEGGHEALYHSDNERLNEFVFASTLMKRT